jgi:predicted dehydrogenase
MKKIGYIGVAHIHTPGFVDRLNKRIQDFEVKAVWDEKPERAKITADKLSSETVSDLSDILGDSEIEAVVICSETNEHERLVELAASAGKHLFVEKPLGMKATDAYRMAQAVEKAGVLFQTGFFMRSQPAHRFIKQQIDSGTLGKITRIRHSNVHSGSLERWFDKGKGWFEDGWLWMTDPAIAGVGAFGDLGAHSLDILMWLMGDVKSVTAQVDVALNNYGCDEFGEGLMRFSNGVVGTLAAGWVDVFNTMPILVAGTDGQVYVNDGQVYFKSKHVAGADSKTPALWTSLPEPLPHAFDLFLDAVQGHDVPLVTVREAADRTAVMEAFYQAATSNTWVEPQKG